MKLLTLFAALFAYSIANADEATVGDWTTIYAPDEIFDKTAHLIEFKFKAESPYIASNGAVLSMGSLQVGCRKLPDSDWEINVRAWPTRTDTQSFEFDTGKRFLLNHTGGDVPESERIAVLAAMQESSTMTLTDGSHVYTISMKGVSATLRRFLDICPANEVGQIKAEMR